MRPCCQLGLLVCENSFESLRHREVRGRSPQFLGFRIQRFVGRTAVVGRIRSSCLDGDWLRVDQPLANRMRLADRQVLENSGEGLGRDVAELGLSIPKER